MCALHNNKTTTRALFWCKFFLHFSFIFPSFFIQKSCTSWHHQTNKDRTLLCRFQSTSWYFWECVIYNPLLAFVFCFWVLSLSLVLLLLLLLLLLYIICFQKSPFPAILFSLLLNLLPRAIKESLPKKKKKKKKKKEKLRKSVPSNRFGFVMVLLKNDALLTFPLYLFNRTNRLGKRPSSLASCTTNSTPRTKRRSASTFYRKRYTWRILAAFDYNCGIQLARSDFDR